MKFSIQSKTLLSQMASVGKAVNPKSPVAILSNFLIRLEGGMLSITGSDQETVITTRVPVSEAEGSGKFCVDAKRVIDLLRAMPDNLVTFRIDDNTLAMVVRYTNGQYDIMAHRADDYPMEGEANETGIVGEFDIPSSQITQCIEKVSFAAGKDDIRPIMQGVLWDVREDAIVFVATDTHHLSKYRSTMTAPGKECRFIIPARVLPMIGNIAGREPSVRVTVSGKSVRFKGENFTLRSSLINGRYPDYDRVIPYGNDRTVKVDRMDLMNAVKRVSICADAQHNLIKMAISGDRILVSSQDLSFSMGGKESVPCEYAGGEDMTIGFASGYLCNILDALTTPSITIRLKDSSSPGLFIPSENDEFGEMTLLCMPINMAEMQ